MEYILERLLEDIEHFSALASLSYTDNAHLETIIVEANELISKVKKNMNEVET